MFPVVFVCLSVHRLEGQVHGREGEGKGQVQAPAGWVVRSMIRDQVHGPGVMVHLH